MAALGATLAAVRSPEELYELLDPDVMWYSDDVDSNRTCNDRDDVVACIERNVAAGLSGRFDVLGEDGDVVVVRPVLDPPHDAGTFCQLFRFRGGLIVEMRDFASAEAASRYAGLAETGGSAL
jgi:hypothetical protein